MTMTISTQATSDQSLLVQLHGHLDAESNLVFKRKLQEISQQPYDCWIIDLANVDFLDSAGLGALINGLALAKAGQTRFILRNPHPSVKMVLEIARLDELFEIQTEPTVLSVQDPTLQDTIFGRDATSLQAA